MASHPKSSRWERRLLSFTICTSCCSSAGKKELCPKRCATPTSSLYKNKGDCSDCNNYCGISLLSIVGKAFVREVLNRLQLLAERTHTRDALRDDAALTAHSEDALQRLINCFAHACREFGLTISLKKTNILGQDVSSNPSITIGDYILEVVEDFTYLGSTISSSFSLDAKLNKRIGKAATATARLAKKVWDNKKLTTNTKMKVYQRALDPLLPPRVQAQHPPSAPNSGGSGEITWKDRVPNKNVLDQAGIPSMFVQLTQRRLGWLGHVRRRGRWEDPQRHSVWRGSPNLAPDLQDDLSYASRMSVSGHEGR
ncbi:uncharacterized protein LOC119598373 [Penaeus monodon]|uniref:uncharacterized protein LOC119598373 n=1 Tax=Penaeus monodon TaxID=6687 RepID=UPI0018A6DF3D|nr:uncharacterized protein LOC119598373 [Penaeus monodon]